MRGRIGKLERRIPGQTFSQAFLARARLKNIKKAEDVDGPAGSPIGRNAACPCGSGKKFKVCCRR